MKQKLIVFVVMGILLGTAGGVAGPVNISGTWAFSVNLDGGPQNVPLTFVFKQEGDRLTGTQSGGLGEANITGTVKGNKVAFIAEAKNRSGELIKISYNGTLESSTKMSGTLEFPKGPGNWTATRE